MMQKQNQILRKLSRCISICGLALLLACTTERIKKKVVLKVQDKTFTVEEFAQELTERLQGMDVVIIKNTEIFEETKRAIARDFIQYAILKNYADKNNIQISKEELSEEIEKFRSNYPDDISFRAAMAEEGISFERWQEKTKKNLLEKKVFQEVTKNVEEPTKEEIAKYYKENRDKFDRKRQYLVKQIVLAKSSDADKLYDQIKKRGSFEKLAMEYSIGAEASKGGLLGWIEEGVSDIFDKAARLPRRSITKPIKSDFGYHIVKVEKQRAPRRLRLSEVEQQIKEDLIEQKQQKHYNSWFEEQKKEATAALNKELLNSITVELK